MNWPVLWQWLSFILIGWSNPVYFGKHSWSGCRSCLQPHHCRNLRHPSWSWVSVKFQQHLDLLPNTSLPLAYLYYMNFIINVNLLFRVCFLVQTSLFRILEPPNPIREKSLAVNGRQHFPIWGLYPCSCIQKRKEGCSNLDPKRSKSSAARWARCG
jgi:hypothetical protein